MNVAASYKLKTNFRIMLVLITETRIAATLWLGMYMTNMLNLKIRQDGKYSTSGLYQSSIFIGGN